MEIETIKNNSGVKWEMVKLGEVVDIKNGRDHKKVNNVNGQYPIIGSGGIMGYADDFLCEGNATIIGRKGSINNPIYIESRFWNVDTAFALCPKKEIEPKFFYYFCTTYNFAKHNKATTLPSLTKTDLLEIQIPLPPLPVQKRIAEILDAADALRRKDQELLKKYDELAQAIFIDMFGSPTKNEVKVSEIIAEGKNKIRSGPFGSDLLHSEFVEEGIFVLGIDNVVNNKFEISRERFITEEKFKSLARYQVFPDDVLISVMATIGRTAVVPENIGIAINSKHLVAITPNKNLINSLYFSYLLSHSESIKQQIKRMSKGAIMDGLNLGIIKDLKFDLPPISKQVLFSQILQSIEHQKELLKKSDSSSLFQTLLQKAFKGELVAE